LYGLVNIMSKIGRKPIECGPVKVTIEGSRINFDGPKDSGCYDIPSFLQAEMKENNLYVLMPHLNKANKKFWGLHRALLNNKIKGAAKEFEKQIKIIGLGFKGEVKGDSIRFSLGFSHKIDLNIPKGITIESDKSGQNLTLKSINPESLGQFCATIRSLRKPEPYKGTGIRLANEYVVRKEGKKKA